MQFRPYQLEALEALDAGWQAGRRRAWLVMPPGAGKTLVGLEAARRLGRPAVVFAPNTAIQGQWVRQARDRGMDAGTGRNLDNDITVLTYQSMAVFDPDAETDEEGHDLVAQGRGLLGRLHSNGQELIDRMRDCDPLTLILDECHHLLDVWGKLLAAVLKELSGELVIGLTGTPPTSLTKSEAKLVDSLFGEPIVGASVPALVRQGYLAPFGELAWIVEPTSVEDGYIEAEAQRFAEMTTDLLGSGFLTWLDSRFTTDAWPHLLKDEPELTAAALRFHHDGLLTLPPVVRLREEHRHRPTAEDWIALLDDYLKHHLLPSDDNRDAATVEAIRKALPSVGYQLTRRGVRRGRSPVDRVLARSAAKTHAAVEIAAAEAAELGVRLRCLVLCDHERASATLPARLRGVLAAEAGSAWLMLERLVTDPRTRDLSPMLVTGKTVAAAPETAREFADWASGRNLTVRIDGDIALIEGSWTSRTWVRLITEFFERGSSQILVGTRGLLGEGWDAPRVNALIDVTTATTATAVVQLRGRAMRLDQAWPEKVAHNWTVVCVTDRHPKGAADWDRFVRKHDGYLAADGNGEIISGVAHVDAQFSPYAPPDVDRFDKINVSMIGRAGDRAAVQESWRLGTEFRDELVHTIRVRPDRAPALPGAQDTVSPEHPPIVPAESLATPPPAGPLPQPAGPTRWGIGFAATGLVALLITPWAGAASLVAGLAAGLIAAAVLAVAVRRTVLRRNMIDGAAAMLDRLAGTPVLPRLAYAVADALAGAGLARRGAEAVRMATDPDGTHHLYLAGDDSAASERFASALDDLISPLANPRYVIPRYIVGGNPDVRLLATAWFDGTAQADGVVYHAIPSVFDGNQDLRRAFTKAWGSWVSDGSPIVTWSPQGEGIMTTHRGESPLDATTVLRLAWE